MVPEMQANRLAEGSQFPASRTLRDFSRYGVSAVNPVSDSFLISRSPLARRQPDPSLVSKKIDNSSEERSRMRARLMARVQKGDGDSCSTLLHDIGPMLMNFLR